MRRPAASPATRLAEIDREISDWHEAFLTAYFAGELDKADEAHEHVDQLLDERWQIQRAACAAT